MDLRPIFQETLGGQNSQIAEMIKKIRNAPGWLGLTDDRTAFVFLPDRAEIVRQIFELSIAGLGGYTMQNF